MAQLRGALAAGDAGAAKTTAHKLKGSAAAVGAVGFSTGASDLEQATGRNDLAAARQGLGHLEGALRALQGALVQVGVVPRSG
jgi:HPt (histidine-containing phosphotransfer) domain-containing protein